jgi:DNA-binding response OmpR family regulator
MHKNKAGWLGLVLFVASAALAQVVSPVEVKDPALRALQQQYMNDLRLAGQDILATQFDLQAVWGPDYGDQVDYLRVFTKNLRKKIETNPERPEYIKTEPWVGYRFNGTLEPL